MQLPDGTSMMYEAIKDPHALHDPLRSLLKSIHVHLSAITTVNHITLYKYTVHVGTSSDKEEEEMRAQENIH